MARKLGKLIWKIFILLLFVTVCAVTLFIAYGYQIDFKKRDVRKTSIIDIPVRQSDVQVLMDSTQETLQLPFQIKNVLPGEHFLEVNKAGYRPWMRKVKVQEDIVSIVEDVLLVPENLDSFIKELHVFEKNARIVYGDDYILSFIPGRKSMEITTLRENGQVLTENIELSHDGLTGVEAFPEETMLLSFDDGSYGWTNFKARQFYFFTLPKGASLITLNQAASMLYFLDDDNLYGIKLQDLQAEKKNYDDLILRENVSVYASALNGDIYFLSDGTIFKMNNQGQQTRLIDFEEESYKNLGIIRGKDFALLLLREKSERRSLVLLTKNGTFEIISSDLKANPVLNSYDQFVFAEEGGNLFFMDPNLFQKPKAAGKIEGEFEIMGWFTDAGHFLVQQSDSLVLTDVFDANKYTLIADISDSEHYLPYHGALFIVKDGLLKRLYMQDQQ